MAIAATHAKNDALADLDVKTTLRLLRGVERLPEGANGALVFGTKDERFGTLLVEDKRVCWAAASGMETRLTDILQRQTKPPIDPDFIEWVLERCRVEGTPGAALVAQGGHPAGLQRALRQHTAEAIVRLSRLLSQQDRFAPTWHPNRTRKNAAQFTFTPAEILVCLRVLGSDDVTSRASRSLEPVMEDSVVAAAFFLGASERDFLPVVQVRGETVGVDGLVQLGSWARCAVELTNAFISGEKLFAATNAGHQTAVSWTAENLLCAALCEDRSSLSVLVAHRARCAPQKG
jgi:hypothetical protein